jgi:hypothetical protein
MDDQLSLLRQKVLAQIHLNTPAFPTTWFRELQGTHF